jgi:hypothetical protein
VQVPSIAPASDKNTVYVYSGNAKATTEAGNATGFDAATMATLVQYINGHYGDITFNAGTTTSNGGLPNSPRARTTTCGETYRRNEKPRHSWRGFRF